MFIPQAVHINGLFDTGSSATPLPHLSGSPRFSLDMSGVVSLLGGDDAVSTMAAVHIYGNRRWLGWYNTPGSFQIAKRLSSFAKSMSSRKHSSKSLSEGGDTDPRTLFGLDSCKGPKFRAAHSGTVIEETGHLATVFMKECAAWNSEGKVIAGRRTQPVGITIADLGQTPAPETHPAQSSPLTILSATIPIGVSISTCMLCAVSGDWYASSLILMGMVASGVSCLVLGSADLIFTHPEPAKGSPAGDGILSSDKEIVLLRGSEGAVNSITRGRFTVRFGSEGQQHLMWLCSALFFIQCITQLLLIPQASLFGQVMFLASLGVSGLYNGWVSSLDKEKIDGKMLFEGVLENPRMKKYTLGTRTTAVVFMLLVLEPRDSRKLLDELLPNDTNVWKQWKATILDQLHHAKDQTFLSQSKLVDLDEFTEQEQDLLELLYEDARAAHRGYMDYLRVESL